jgi:hypothetical protein
VRFNRKPLSGSPKNRTRTRFALFPVTCYSDRNRVAVETRWLETVTTYQECTTRTYSAENARRCGWEDIYFIDDHDVK